MCIIEGLNEKSYIRLLFSSLRMYMETSGVKTSNISTLFICSSLFLPESSTEAASSPGRTSSGAESAAAQLALAQGRRGTRRAKQKRHLVLEAPKTPASIKKEHAEANTWMKQRTRVLEMYTSGRCTVFDGGL